MKIITLIAVGVISITTLYGQSVFQIKDRPVMQKPVVIKKTGELKSSYSTKSRLELEKGYSFSGQDWIFTEKKENTYFDTNYLKSSTYSYRNSELDGWTIEEFSEFEYDANGNIITEIQKMVGAQDEKYINTYNADNYLTEQVVQVYNNGWVNSRKQSYSFNTSGVPVSVTYYYWNSSESNWIYGSITNFTLDNENHVIEEITLDRDTNYDGIVNDEDHIKTVYVYENSRLVTTELWSKMNGGTWQVYNRVIATFENDKLKAYQGYRFNWGSEELELFWTESWNYDSYGNPSYFIMSDLDNEGWYTVKGEYLYDMSQSMDDYVIPPLQREVNFINKVIGYNYYVEENGNFFKVNYGELYYTGEVSTSAKDVINEKVQVTISSQGIQFIWTDSFDDTNFSLYTINGVLVKEMSIKNRQLIYTSDIKPGVYIYKLQNKRGSLNVGKIIVR